MPILALAALAMLCGIPQAKGANLSPPFMYDSANVLPKGVRNLRFQGATSEVSHTYNEVAAPVSLANSFNRDLTYTDLIQNLNANDQAEYGGYLKSMNIDPDSQIGETQGAVAVRVTATVPAIAYGLTDRWTVGMAVPIVYSDMSIATGFIGNPQLTQTLQVIALQDRGTAGEAANKMTSLVQYMAKLKHYEPMRDEAKTQLGDVNLVSKYQIAKNDTYGVAVSNSLVLPTGNRPNINKVVDVGSGDGDFKASATGVVDYYAHRKVTLTGAAGYTAQLPDQLPLRIPESRNNTLSSDIDETVYRDLGDIVRGSAFVKLTPTTEWTVQAGYTYQAKMPDRYRGAQYAQDRYALLEEKTDQTMQAAQMGLAFSTVQLYRRQKFLAPMEAAVNYTSIYDGRNVSRDGLTSFEFSMFF